MRTERVENASCEFDVETLSPTYKLLIGVPGRSNAFAISRHLNLKEEIIEAAQVLISEENTRFEDVVDSLEKTRLQMEDERRRTEELKQQIDEMKASVQLKLDEAQKKSDKEVERAQNEAKRIVENAKRAANSLMLEIEMLRKEQVKEKNAAEMARKARAAMKQHLNAIDDLTSEAYYDDDNGDYMLPRPLKVGDNVRITTLGTDGTVVSVTDSKGNVEVQAGIIKTKVPEDTLRLLGDKKKKSEPSKRRTVRTTDTELKTQSAKTSVDLRGMDREEAIMELDRFIDGIVRSGLNEFTVIHGKGTGVLRKAVQAHLKKHPNIRTYRTGIYGEGEEGVTIAELK